MTSSAKDTPSYVPATVCSMMLSRRISSSDSCHGIPSTLVLPTTQYPVRRSTSPAASIPSVPELPVFTGYGATDVFSVDQHMRTPYIQSYNLESGAIVGQRRRGEHRLCRFPGTKALPLYRSQPGQSGKRHAIAYPAVSSTSTSFSPPLRRTTTRCRPACKISNFHGVMSTLNFTYGHSIDNASDGQDYVTNATQPDNSFNPAAERANSNFDLRRSFKWYWSYDLPKSESTQVAHQWLVDQWRRFAERRTAVQRDLAR